MSEVQIDRSIGIALRSARTRAGLTLNSLAQLSGLSQPHLSQMENGKASPSINSLYRIASVLDISPQELLPPVQEDVVRVLDRESAATVPLSDALNAARVRLLLNRAQHGVQVQQTTILENSDLGNWFTHEGEELVIVARGSLIVEMEHNPTPIVLGEGDAAAYPSMLPHRWRSSGPYPTSVIAVLIAEPHGKPHKFPHS